MDRQFFWTRLKNNVGELLNSNKVFFIGYVLFLVVSAILLVFIDQGDEIFFFSDRRSAFGDLFFKYFTKMGEEWGYLIGMILLLFVGFRYVLLLPVTGLFVMLVANLSKSFFAHPRPASYFADTALWEQIHLVAGVHLNMSSTSSFPSGHTMGGFALFSLMAFFLPKKKWTGPVCLIAAVLVGISRIYLVQHFLKDVFLGAIIGVLIGMIMYFTQLRILSHKEKWYNKKIAIGKV